MDEIEFLTKVRDAFTEDLLQRIDIPQTQLDAFGFPRVAAIFKEERRKAWAEGHKTGMEDEIAHKRRSTTYEPENPYKEACTFIPGGPKNAQGQLDPRPSCTCGAIMPKGIKTSPNGWFTHHEKEA